jgi:hypothetical protein
MNDVEIKTEANNTVIPEAIGVCILLFIFNFITTYISRKDFYGSVVLSIVATLILSPLIYYFKLNSQVKKLQKIRDSIKEAYDNVGVDGFTELMALCIDNKIEEVRKNLDAGVGIDLQNTKGYTALIYASNFGREEVVKLLLERGANKKLTTSNGNDALYFAKNNKFKNISKLLR